MSSPHGFGEEGGGKNWKTRGLLRSRATVAGEKSGKFKIREDGSERKGWS